MKAQIVVALLVVVLALSGCATTTTPPTPLPAVAVESTIAPAATSVVEDSGEGNLAVILSGPWADNGWNEAAYLALQELREEGVRVAYTENVDPADAPRILREYVAQGYRMIVGHSFGFQDAVFDVASEYSDVNFAWGGGINRTAKNVADYDQPFYEASYSVGIIAGYMSKSGMLGAMYGFDIPVCHAMGEAFLAGAKSVNPDARLITTAVGDWADVAKAKEAALAQADVGVDFWIECGQGPSLGTIEAAKERGGYATGHVGDMSENGPDVVLTNVIWDPKPMFTKMVEETMSGSFDSPWYYYGVSQGAVKMTYNEALKSEIPVAAVAAADQVMEDIKAGTFVVPFIPEAK